MPDPYHLQRFVDAQASCFAQVTVRARRWKKALPLDVVHISRN